LYFLKENVTIKNKQAIDINGNKSENAMKKEFYKLRDEELIEWVPNAGRYG